MKVTLHSTTKVVEVGIEREGERVFVPARVWEGVTANGVRCHAFITRIAVHNDDDRTEFERDLAEQWAPSPEVDAIPLRMVL